MLSSLNLTVRWGEQVALRQVDVALAAGRWTAIVGPNGAGKSTLLRALAGLQR
ncbi:MAG: ATP-binding cassette domain-containing protein, partial [Aquabacterium sp.]